MQPSASFSGLRARLVEAIDSRLAAAEANGLRPEDLGDPLDLASRVAAAIPTRHPSAELVGACYDGPGLARWLGVSRQAVSQRNKARTFLGCRTTHGRWVYPAWQFDSNRRPIPHLAELITILAGEDDRRRWRAARWLAAPCPNLPGRVSAANWLGRGGDPEPVLSAARADARRWSA